ncbi:MAG: hypothetical protein AB8B85_07105 [Paracoccaceae bacterium]
MSDKKDPPKIIAENALFRQRDESLSADVTSIESVLSVFVAASDQRSFMEELEEQILHIEDELVVSGWPRARDKLLVFPDGRMERYPETLGFDGLAALSHVKSTRGHLYILETAEKLSADWLAAKIVLEYEFLCQTTDRDSSLRRAFEIGRLREQLMATLTLLKPMEGRRASVKALDESRQARDAANAVRKANAERVKRAARQIAATSNLRGGALHKHVKRELEELWRRGEFGDYRANEETIAALPTIRRYLRK